MDSLLPKLPRDPALRDRRDLNRSLHDVECHVDVRIRHNGLNSETGDRVIDHGNHEKSFL